MKQFLLPALFALTFIACSNSGNEYNPVSGAKLKIKNESSYDIKNVTWNDVSFGEIKMGSSGGDSVNAGSGYIYFTKTADNLGVRTDAVLIIEQNEQKEFVIRNNTVVIEIVNSDNKKALSAIEATPPTFGNLMPQGKDLAASVNWNSADYMCRDSRVAGYSDWRLPTRSELGVIHNNKSLVSELNSDLYYWSSEPDNNNRRNYYHVYDMKSGSVFSIPETDSIAVRCVRTTTGSGNNPISSAKLTIKNESSYEIKNIIWNNVSFDEIKWGSFVEKSVSAGSGYIYFTKTAYDLEVRTDTMLVMEQNEQKEFVIRNNTVVTEIANSDNKETLNAIEATLPAFENLMLQGKDLAAGAEWNSANEMCIGSIVSGYLGWRLPTRSELGVIYGHKSLVSGLNSDLYWSSEKIDNNSSEIDNNSSEIDNNNSSNYYVFNMTLGQVSSIHQDKLIAVRCVRTKTW